MEQYLQNTLFIGIIIELNYQNVHNDVKFTEDSPTMNIVKLKTP